MDRRKFLIQCSGSIVKASAFSSLFFSGAVSFAAPASEKQNSALSEPSKRSYEKLFKRKQWQTLSAIQAHMFPAKNGAPGASQFNAKAWLYNFLSYPNSKPEVIKIYRTQLDKVDHLSKESFNTSFISLSTPDKEKILRKIEKNPQSQRWLAEILNNIIEALLTDPIYGGNPHAVGWKWLDHSPGFPRPNSQQKYYML